MNRPSVICHRCGNDHWGYGCPKDFQPHKTHVDWDACVRCGLSGFEITKDPVCHAPENAVSEQWLERKRHEREFLKPLLTEVFPHD